MAARLCKSHLGCVFKDLWSRAFGVVHVTSDALSPQVVGQERGLQDGGATLSALLVAFAKYAGEEVLGLKPVWRHELDALVAEDKKPLEGQVTNPH